MPKYLSLLIIVLFTIPLLAQSSDDSANEDDNDVTQYLSPFAIEALDLQGLYPRTWQTQENAPGVFLRAIDALDTTAIIMQSRSGTADALLQEIMISFDIDSDAEAIAAIEGNYFQWETYQFERRHNNRSVLIIDLALAQLPATTADDDPRIYYVLMQTAPAFHDDLYAQAFIPAVTYLSPIQHYQDDRISFPIPTTWTLTQHTDYVTLQDAQQQLAVHIASQTADDPIAAMQALLQAIDPTLDLTLDRDDASALRILDDAALLNGLDAIYVVTWTDETATTPDDARAGQVVQGIARVQDDQVHMMLIIGDGRTLTQQRPAILMLDRGFRVLALTAPAESTVAADA